uniref:Uncharacterized protein n=1 Tax=Arion vulgaris TaxID=1028688 RepID=A0A0B7AW93_9EUPU
MLSWCLRFVTSQNSGQKIVDGEFVMKTCMVLTTETFVRKIGTSFMKRLNIFDGGCSYVEDVRFVGIAQPKPIDFPPVYRRNTGNMFSCFISRERLNQ